MPIAVVYTEVNVAMAERQRFGYPTTGVGQGQRKCLNRRNRCRLRYLQKPLPLDGSQVLAATLIDQCDVSVVRHNTASVLYRTIILQTLALDRLTEEYDSVLQLNDTECQYCLVAPCIFSVTELMGLREYGKCLPHIIAAVQRAEN